MNTLAAFDRATIEANAQEQITAMQEAISIIWLTLITLIAAATIVLLIIAWVSKARTAK